MNLMSRIVNIHTHHHTGNAIEPMAIGIHPWEAASRSVADIEPMIADADAVGEIGLDGVCDVDIELQFPVFREQLALAERFSKPVVIHCVRTFEQVMKCLDSYRLKAVIFHGFIGSPEQAERAVSRGYFLSFGERTIHSPKTIKALRSTPLSHIFIESDESPVPIEQIYEQIADLLAIDPNKLIEEVRRNFEMIFL